MPRVEPLQRQREQHHVHRVRVCLCQQQHRVQQGRAGGDFQHTERRRRPESGHGQPRRFARAHLLQAERCAQYRRADGHRGLHHRRHVRAAPLVADKDERVRRADGGAHGHGPRPLVSAEPAAPLPVREVPEEGQREQEAQRAERDRGDVLERGRRGGVHPGEQGLHQNHRGVARHRARGDVLPAGGSHASDPGTPVLAHGGVSWTPLPLPAVTHGRTTRPTPRAARVRHVTGRLAGAVASAPRRVARTRKATADAISWTPRAKRS